MPENWTGPGVIGKSRRTRRAVEFEAEYAYAVKCNSSRRALAALSGTIGNLFSRQPWDGARTGPARGGNRVAEPARSFLIMRLARFAQSAVRTHRRAPGRLHH